MQLFVYLTSILSCSDSAKMQLRSTVISLSISLDLIFFAGAQIEAQCIPQHLHPIFQVRDFLQHISRRLRHQPPHADPEPFNPHSYNLDEAFRARNGFGSELDIICFGDLPRGTGRQGLYGVRSARKPKGWVRSDFSSLTDLCSWAGNPYGNYDAKCIALGDGTRRVSFGGQNRPWELNDMRLLKACRDSCMCRREWDHFLQASWNMPFDSFLERLREHLGRDEVPAVLIKEYRRYRSESRGIIERCRRTLRRLPRLRRHRSGRGNGCQPGCLNFGRSSRDPE